MVRKVVASLSRRLFHLPGDQQLREVGGAARHRLLGRYGWRGDGHSVGDEVQAAQKSAWCRWKSGSGFRKLKLMGQRTALFSRMGKCLDTD